MRLSWPSRCIILASGVAVLSLLVIARSLEPAPQGFGTHQQLGLPPCTSVVLFDANCPACGMTTSWAHLTRGHWMAAVRTNAGGSLLAIIALVYLPASCYFFFGGRSSPRSRFSLLLGCSLLTALAVSIAQWAYRLAS